MAADNALIDTDEARVFIDAVSTDKPSDGWLQVVIDGISQEISDVAGRVWLPASTDPEPRAFDHDLSVVCAIQDCTDPQLVRVSADPRNAGSWLELQDDDWTAEPASKDTKHEIRFLLPLSELPATNSGWVFGRPQYGGQLREEWPREARYASTAYLAVEVTALWGAGPPANVKLAALMWLDHIHKRVLVSYSRDFSDQSANIGAMPDEIHQMIVGQQRARGRVAAV